jgi:Na+-driven multidrug efflux pump
MIGFLTGLANGFGIMTAQKFGGKDQKGVKQSFAVALILGIGMTLILTITSVLFLNPILRFLNIPDYLLKTAKQYVLIILLGMIVTVLYDILMAVMRAIGDSVTPLIILSISVFLNIAGDLFFLTVVKTGVWGAAAATVGAQFVSLCVCTIYLVKSYKILHFSKEDVTSVRADMVKNMFSMGISMALTTSIVNIGTLILQTAINGLGEAYIVAHTAARKMTELTMSVHVILGTTMATYCSQNYGAGEYGRIREGLKVAIFYNFIWYIIVMIMSFTIGPWLIYMVTGSTNPLVIQTGTNYMRFDTSFYFVVLFVFLLRNTLQGVGDRITPLVSSGLELISKIIMTKTLVSWLGYTGVILVEPIIWFIMVIPLVIQMLRHPVMREKSNRNRIDTIA